MKILFIGDVFGRVGRKILNTNLHKLIEENSIDFTIANGENSAGGLGITLKVKDELFNSGIDVITGGNHTLSKKEIISYLNEDRRLLRPLNYPPGVPGFGMGIYKKNGLKPVCVINLIGRVFMDPVDCPFRTVRREIEQVIKITPIIIVDFHAEATAEKMAMGWYLAGQVSAVIGTHTHVQTADEIILEGGTAYITDVGMTGPFDSVIGIDKRISIEKFLTQMPIHFEPAKNDARLSAVIIDIDDNTGKSISIKRLCIKYNDITND